MNSPDKALLGIAAIMKNEGPYLVEWLAHHRCLGVQDFFVEVNNDNRLLFKAFEDLRFFPPGRKFAPCHGELPITDLVAERQLRLPLWTGLESPQDRVIEVLHEALGLLKSCRVPSCGSTPLCSEPAAPAFKT
jgi:hypothetical protein